MKSTFVGLLVFGCFALLAASPAARGQSAPTLPATVPGEADLAPDDANLALKHSLDQRRSDLLQRFQKWNENAQEYNSKYSGLDANSPGYPTGQTILANLSADLASYNGDNEAFASDVGKLVLQPPQAAPPVPGSGFDSRTLVTRDDYVDALGQEQDLLRRHKLLADELAKLKGWQQGLQSDADEFAAIQSEAQIDCLHDVLMKIPASATVGILADAHYLTSDEAVALSAGYDALKTLVSGAEGLGTGDDQEKTKKILEAHKSIRAAMMDQAVEKLRESNPAAYGWLEGLGKSFDVASQMIVFAAENNHSGAAWGKFGVSLCTTVVPLTNFIVIADTVGEKKLTQHYVQVPLDSLNEALSKNFNAQRYLTQKLDPIDRNLAIVQETAKKFQAVHPRSEW